MTGGLGGSITDLGHGSLTGEAATDTIINTLGFAPCLLDGLEAIRLMTLEGLGALLNDSGLVSGRDHIYKIKILVFRYFELEMKRKIQALTFQRIKFNNTRQYVLRWQWID